MATAARIRPMRVRNTRRAVWFFPFEVDESTAALAKGVAGLKVERADLARKRGTRREIEEGWICTLALGDAEGKPDLGDLAAEVTIPGEVWLALLADPRQGPAMRGLIAGREISVYPDPEAVAG